jgi:hypothetical protein
VGEGGVTPIRTYGEHEALALGLLVDPDEEVADEIVLPAAAVRPGFLEALRRKTVIK